MYVYLHIRNEYAQYTHKYIMYRKTFILNVINHD